MNVNTPVFVANFPKILKPELNKLNGKMEYSVIAVYPKGTNLDALKKVANEACVKAWGADQSKWPKPANGKTFGNPFRKGEEKMKVGEDGKNFIPAPYEEGCVWMNFKSAQRPGVVDRSLNKIIDESEIYSGVKLIASVRAYAYNQAGNVGVSFGLQNIQKVGDGDPIGGRMRPEDTFAPIDGVQDDASAVTGGAASLF